MLAITDTAIAAQNAVVAAESLGIGSCYIGDIMENCEEQRRLLQLPEYDCRDGRRIFRLQCAGKYEGPDGFSQMQRCGGKRNFGYL